MLKINLTWETTTQPVTLTVKQCLTKGIIENVDDAKVMFMHVASAMYDDIMRNVELMGEFE